MGHFYPFRLYVTKVMLAFLDFVYIVMMASKGVLDRKHIIELLEND